MEFESIFLRTVPSWIVFGSRSKHLHRMLCRVIFCAVGCKVVSHLRCVPRGKIFEFFGGECVHGVCNWQLLGIDWSNKCIHMCGLSCRNIFSRYRR